MKATELRGSRGLPYIVTFIVIVVGLSPSISLSQEPASHQPPPLPPFPNIERPTEQTKNIDDLLSFLPDVLATYGSSGEITKSRFIDEMGIGFDFALQQGRQMNRQDIRKAVAQLVDAMINLEIMVEIATKDGMTPRRDDAVAEIKQIKQRMGAQNFVKMLSMQNLTETEFTNKVSRKLMIDRWIESKVVPAISVTSNEIDNYFNKNRTTFENAGQATRTLELDSNLSKEIETRLRQIKSREKIKSYYDTWKDEKGIQILF